MKRDMAELLDTIELLEQEKEEKQRLYDEISRQIEQENERMDELKVFVSETQFAYKKEIRELNQDLESTRDQVIQREADVKEVIGYLKNVREDNRKLKEQLSSAEAKISTLTQLLNKRFKKLESYQLALDDLRLTKASEDSS